MILVDEDGPIEKVPLTRFPVSRGNRHMFESLAAPVSRDLDQHAAAIGSSTGAMMPVAARDINGDFAHSIPGAVGEISGQLGSQSEIDPAPIYVAALESVDDLAGSGDGLPPEGTTSGGVTGGGGSEFGIVQWQEAGAGAPPAAPRPPSGPGGPGLPPEGEPGEPEPPPTGGEPPPPPPGEPAPGEPPPPGDGQPAPEPMPEPSPAPPPEEDEPLF